MEQITRVAVFGPSGVGKSAICMQFCTGYFLDNAYDPTCGDCGSSKILQLPTGKQIHVDLLESTGSEEHTAMLELFCKQCSHALLVFDITSLVSFKVVSLFWERVVSLRPTMRNVLVGNKSDLEDKREVSKEQGSELASSLGCDYIETSAKCGWNVNEAVIKLVESSVPGFVSKKEFSSLIVSDVEKMFNNAAFSDLSIMVENKCIYLHKTLVCAKFPTFLEFFNESGSFTPKDIPYDHLVILTRWIYTGIFNPPFPESLRSSIVALNLFPLLPLLDQTDSSTQSISFSIFFNESTLSDIQIMVEKKIFFAHKVILACRSQYFNTMFTAGFKETNVGTIKLKDFTVPIFEELLRYIYIDQINVNETNWQELLIAGQKYNINGVLDHVGKFLLEQMNWENVVEIYKICLEFPNFDYLLEKVKYVVGYNHALVIQTHSFKKLEKEKQEALNEMEIPGSWDSPKVIKQKENCILQ